MSHVIGILAVFLLGMISTYVIMVARMMRNRRADDSNLNNPSRVLNQFIIHEHDFMEMYYLTEAEMDILNRSGFDPRLAFWYWDKDEYADVVKTRPPKYYANRQEGEEQ